MDGLLNAVDRLTVDAEFVDKTQEIKEICSRLSVGEILRDPSFTLFDALAAIEIMDPKMDTGMLTLEQTKYTPESCYAFQPSFKDLAHITHRLLRAEASWWAGKTLAQTVLAGYFTHDGHAVRDNLLSLIVRSTMASVELVIELGNTSFIVFEEDLIRDMHGVRPLKCDTQKLMDEIQRALDHPSLVSSKGDADDENFVAFLRAALGFRKSFLNLLMHASDYELDDKYMNKIIEKIRDSLVLLKPSFECPLEVYGFESLATKRLSLTAPLSEITLKTFDETMLGLSKLVDDLEMFARNYSKVHNVHTMIDLLSQFASRRPNIVTRLVVHQWITQNKRIFDMVPATLIVDSVFKCCNFKFPKDKPFEDMVSHLKAFGVELLFDTCRVFCFNLSRLRRKLAKLLHMWDEFQAEAENIDSWYQEKQGIQGDPYPIANWIYSLKLGLCETVLLYGFDLELYLPNEIPSIYLYLDLLYTSQIKNLQRCYDLKSPGSTNEYRELYIALKQELCRGLVRFIAGLKKEGLIEIKESVLKHEESRYNHRFKQIMKLGSPQPFSYETYAKNSDVSLFDSSLLFQNAVTGFETAKLIVSKFKSYPCSPEFYVGEGMDVETEILSKCVLSNSVSLKVTQIKLDSLKSANVKTSFEPTYSKRFLLISNSIKN